MILELVYILTLLFDIALINTLVFWKKEKKDKEIVKSLRQLIVAVSITVLSSMLAIKLPDKEMSLFLQTFHYASTEWMLIFLMRFLEVYVGGIAVTKVTRALVGTYSAICSASLLLNCIFHHVVTSESIEVNGMMIYVFHTISPAYDLHLYFCYFMVLCSLIVLGYGTFRTVKLYRKKYYLAWLMLFFTIVMDALFKVFRFDHDFSLYGYCSLGFFFIYFAFYYKPKSIITKTLSYLVEDSHNRVMCFDQEDHCIFVNEQARQFYGEDVSFEQYEKKCKELLQVDTFQNVNDKKWLIERNINGEDMFFEYTFSRLFDERNGYIGCYFSVYNKTEDVVRYREQRYLATHDSLTGLFNRDYFFDKALKLIKKNADKRYYIICTDVKDFKLINELFGYEKGNEILVGFAAQLKESLEEELEMFSARLNSDRFVILVPKELYEEQRLLDCICGAQRLFKTSKFQLHIHAGVYEAQPEDGDVSIMCDHANMAIRVIKNDYDRVIAYYDDNLMNQMINRNHMLNEFDSALEEKQFVMYLQPQVDTDGKVLGAEALVRWIHPQQGMISPGAFIPVFEESGVIHRLDQYIWEQASRKLKEWKENGREDLYISVNISAKDFYYIDIYKTFTHLAEKYDISPNNLKLEITETALMQEMDKQLELLTRLQNYGFHVEIDDFGSGYSSLNMLKNIRADVLKIDMGFLQEIKDHERATIILGMVVELAKQLQMNVITEGVETKEQVEYLKKVGCDMFQGFYFARPIPVDDFESEYI